LLAITKLSSILGYAFADHLQMAVSHQGDNDPKDMARLNSIIKTWFKNKVLDIEERKDADFAMLRLILLALLPQVGGVLLMVGRNSRPSPGRRGNAGS
jgi:hypothetical protein